MDSSPFKIKINRTEADWKALEIIAQRKTKTDFRIWLSYEIKQFAKQLNAGNICLECNEPPPLKRVNNFDIPFQVFKEIDCLSKRFNIGNSTLVQRFIIDKYLAEYYSESGFEFEAIPRT